MGPVAATTANDAATRETELEYLIRIVDEIEIEG